MVVNDDLERPRLTVLFRLFLAIPHFVWFALWSIAVFFAVFAAWILALILGRVPDALHRFLAAYVRYGTHLIAFVYLIGRRFPGFTGRAGSYGIDVEIDPPTQQSRWKTLFRFFLSIPALILASALGGVAFVIAFLAWWYAPRDRADAGRDARPRRRVPALLGSDVRVRAARDEPTTRTAHRSFANPSLPRRGRATGHRAVPRRRRLLRAAFAALVFAALAVGAFLLYPTAVPDDLTLPALDVDAVFGADFVADAKRYERVFYALWVLAQIALLLTLWLYARRGAGLTRESSAGPIGTGMLLGMLGLGIVWLVHLPFSFTAHWWARRNEQSELGYVDWLFEDWAILGAQFLSVCIALARRDGARALARRLVVASGRRRVRRPSRRSSRSSRRTSTSRPTRWRIGRCSPQPTSTAPSSASGTSRSGSRR